MQSALTRTIIQRILRSEPIVHSDCIYRHGRELVHHGRRPHFFQPRRTLFGFRSLLPAAKKSGKNPGLTLMVDAKKKMDLRLRMPPAKDLAKAWTEYFEDKSERNEQVQDAHAAFALTTFEYLQSVSKEEAEPLVSISEMEAALRVLADKALKGDGKVQKLEPSYITLAEKLYLSLCSSDLDTENRQRTRQLFIRILTFSFNAHRARDVLITESDPQVRFSPDDWYLVASGFDAEGDFQALKDTVRLLEQECPSMLESLASNLAQTFARLDAMNEAKRFYSQAEKSKNQHDPSLYKALIMAAVRNEEFEWGRSIIQNLMDDSKNQITERRELWDVVFLWAAGTGKSVDEVDRMMQVMVRRNPEFTPNIKTINQLIAYANSRNDPYLAERFLALGAKWSVDQDGTTYMYQMDYRLATGDIDGARTAYYHLKDEEIRNNEDLPRINRLIQCMCNSGHYEFDTIMEIVEDYNSKRKPFEADTVSALCILHLKRHEYYDVVDLLQTQVGNYDTSERTRIRDTFVDFCFDRRNSITSVWDAYMIFHQVFDAETNCEIRTRIMNEFLTRRRSDMAVHVFNHMREHRRVESQSTADTYIDILTGIGRLEDQESLEVVHNQLKLDMNVEPNTRLQNSLMIAYLGCDFPNNAYRFWQDIIHSNEGPNYNSLLIVMRVCEKMPFGETRAKEIWRQLGELDVEVTSELFAAYVGALAGNDLVNEAMEKVNSVEKEFGLRPNTLM